jgi:hypothetical protein
MGSKRNLNSFIENVLLEKIKHQPDEYPSVIMIRAGSILMDIKPQLDKIHR